MNYRNFATQNWTDDTVLSMSPEQKLLFLYLHTSPFTSACGIFKLQPKMMGFQLGLTHTPFESSLKGLVAAFPDWVAVDWDTMEVALLQYPRQLLITANVRALNAVKKDIDQVQSTQLLSALIRRNSAGLSAPYVSRLRSLQMSAVNQSRTSSPPPAEPIMIEEYPDIPIQEDAAPAQSASLADSWQPAAQHMIRVIEENPGSLQMHLKGNRALPQDWKEQVDARMRHFQAAGEWFLITIPSDSGRLYRWQAQMLAKIASWIDNPINQPKPQNGYTQPQKQQTADFSLSKYKPKT